MLLERYRRSNLYHIFNLHDDRAKGRTVMLSSTILNGIVCAMIDGVFYTSFLMQNGINLVNIGIISFVPSIANCFSIFAPSILERFPVRRRLLIGARFLYYLLNILGVTLVPMLIANQQLKVVLFVIIVFLANLINSIANSGYTAWHLHFIPHEIRKDYYPASSTISTFTTQTSALIAAIVADAYVGTENAALIITTLRFVAFGIAMVELWVLAQPREFPYETTGEKPRFKDIVTMPWSEKRFMLIMLLLFIHNFAANLPSAQLNYYLLNDIGVQYTLIQAINFAYPIAMLLFIRYWKRALNSIGWIRTYMLSLVLTVPTIIAYSCVTKSNYLWLLTALRLVQHFVMMGTNVAGGNMAYLYMPPEKQTNYISFSVITTSMAVFLGTSCGTLFVGLFPDIHWTLGSLTFGSVQVLMWFEAIGYITCAFFCCKVIRYLRNKTPEGIVR